MQRSRKENMTKTIEFNTGRSYTAEGQVIVATLYDDNVVTFMDHSRGVDGEFTMSNPALFCQRLVMDRYDTNEAPSSKRSWEDGMLCGGCNTRTRI